MADDDEPTRGIRGVIFGFGDFSPRPEQVAEQVVDFGPGFDETFDNGIQMAKEMKEWVVRDGPCDIPSLCIAMMPAGNFHLPVAEMCDGAGLRPPEAIAICLQVVTQSMGPPIAVCVLLETLWEKVSTHEQVTEHEAGSLSARWNDGDRQGLGEALVIMQATSERCASLMLPYHYGDGSVVWEDKLGIEINQHEGWPHGSYEGNVEQALLSVLAPQKGEADGSG